MAHIQQQQFCKKIKSKYPSYFKNKKVLDIGSLDINGNNKFLFENCNYVGLDVDSGPNVDVISPAHLYDAPNNSFDVIMSTEVFEHDMYYKESIKNMMRILKDGGSFIFTCASIGRVEHGTLRTDSQAMSPLLQNISSDWANYYKNLTESDIKKIKGFTDTFPDGYFEYNPTSCDLYFFGIKGRIINPISKLEIDLKSNKVYLNTRNKLSGYIEIISYIPDNDLHETIYSNKIQISPDVNYWYSPRSKMSELNDILIYIKDNNGNVIFEKKFNSNLNLAKNKLQILDTIAIKYNTDKSSIFHNYCEKYQKYLNFKRTDIFNLLEIGVDKGNSVKMWKEYFYNANIIGIDIDNKCEQYQEENINIEIGSQNDKEFLNLIGDKYKKFDVILDDGSHQMSDVIFSFENLFKFVNDGGVYIIEDSCTSYWDIRYRGGLYKSHTIIEYFKRLIDDVNYHGVRDDTNNRKESLLNNIVKDKKLTIKTDIESIVFLNSIIIINKK